MIFLRERERTNHKISNENKYIKFFSEKRIIIITTKP